MSADLKLKSGAKVDPAANTRLAHQVLKNVKSSDMFTDRTTLANRISETKEDDLTFDFDLILYLSKPL